ncbi:MAG: hypothetical protein EBZ77_03775 [Chitinophagia bacterium]|nr:hypothetical protein [Chitinophagia bacterium]
MPTWELAKSTKNDMSSPTPKFLGTFRLQIQYMKLPLHTQSPAQGHWCLEQSQSGITAQNPNTLHVNNLFMSTGYCSYPGIAPSLFFPPGTIYVNTAAPSRPLLMVIL